MELEKFYETNAEENTRPYSVLLSRPHRAERHPAGQAASGCAADAGITSPTLAFDTAAEFTGTNKSPADVLGVTSSESWSGYSLRVAGDKPARIAFPEINAASKTNLAFNHGAVRLWFRGDWSSAGLGGKGPGSDVRLLSLHSAAKAGVAERALAFDPSGDSLYCADVNGEHLLQAKIGWPAGSWHQVVLNYSATGTMLFLDGELVAKGQGVAAWPKAAARFFTLGSDANGENLAQGEFEEFTTFARNLTPEEIAANYRAYATVAQLGPITPEEEAAKKEHQAKLIAARKSGAMQMSLAPPGGGGGGGTNGAGGGYSYLTAQTGLRLVDPAWQSNVFTATIAGGEEGGRYDLFFTTNLSVTNAWSFMTRTAPGQTNLLVAPADPGFFLLGTMLDADGDTLTDAYEALLSKTDPAAFTSYASTGGTGALAAVLFDEPAVVRISQVNIYQEFAPHCPVIPSLVPAAGNTTYLNWALGQGGSSLSNLWFLSCPGNGHIGSFYAQTLWNSNDVASCETWYAGQSHVAGTNCSAPPTNFPAEYCLIAAAAGENTFVRTAATAVELVTGGPKFSLSSNLFLIHVTATERTNTPLTGAGLTIGLKATNIIATNITIFGQQPDTNGDLYVMLPDREIFDLTPTVPAQYSNYVFTVSDQKLGRLEIWATLYELDTNTPPVIVSAAGDSGDTEIYHEVNKKVDYLRFEAFAGDLIRLEARWKGGANAPQVTMSNVLWNIPGIKLSQFFVSNDQFQTNGYPIYLSSPITNQVLDFKFITGHTNERISLQAMVGGIIHTSWVDFTVRRIPPNIILTGRTNGIGTLDTNNFSLPGVWAHYGKPTNPGIAVYVSHEIPTKPIGSDEIRFVQTETSAITVISNGVKWVKFATNVLDSFHPYPAVTLNRIAYDLPGNPIFTNYTYFSRSDTFTMFVLRRRNFATNAEHAPYYKITWPWSVASTNIDGNWIITSPTQPSPTIVEPTFDFPQWNGNIREPRFQLHLQP